MCPTRVGNKAPLVAETLASAAASGVPPLIFDLRGKANDMADDYSYTITDLGGFIGRYRVDVRINPNSLVPLVATEFYTRRRAGERAARRHIARLKRHACGADNAVTVVVA